MATFKPVFHCSSDGNKVALDEIAILHAHYLNYELIQPIT